jgi:hypothetical protein
VPEGWRWPLAGLALAGFAAALAVHAAALSGVDVQALFPGVMALHAGIFVVFLPFVFFMRRTFGPRPGWAALRGSVPGPVLVAGAALMAYAVANFLWCVGDLRGGAPAVVDGRHVLEHHGRVLREITAAEFTHARATEVRLFSGHWMAFFFMPFAAFAFVRPPATDGVARA